MTSMAGKRVFVIGVGMTKFEKPFSKQWDYPDMGREAGREALQDAGIPYKEVQSVVASYCYGEPTCGQRAVYELGLTGIPVFNVNNNCSSGSSALMLARSLIQSGMNCVMAVGFEKMERGLSARYPDKVSPTGRHTDHMETIGAKPGLIAPNFDNLTSDIVKMFAYAAREYCEKHPNVTFDDFVQISYKNHMHGQHNSRACFQQPMPKSAIAAEKRMLCPPITAPMAAFTADGGACAIVASEDYVLKNNLQNRAVEILAQHMVSDLPSTFKKSFIDLSGFSMAKKAAQQCYQETGLDPDKVNVVEVHDCFSCNEFLMYEALQLAEEGKAKELLDSGRWIRNKEGGELFQLGGKWVVNPSGGLESKGHPIGATGLGQCAELVWQLRGEAGKRQVPGAKVGLQHNFGIGGAAVVTMYRKMMQGALAQQGLHSQL